ncbi:class III extradiol dioxygenase subunit B-like domain-containing protein [Streptomyces sp. NPDC051211]|uniref:class III extradiol dioxygenase subunit B-like domain-containing protein n=1 Tax=Streptomyces sp. NPDC051211 TaxID=3154643 RepID=UPI00344C77BF
MLVAAAVCPSPPLLVPEVAAGAAQELAEARTACSDALAVLAASRPDLLVVVGAAEKGGGYDEGTPGTFAGFGVDLSVTLGSAAAEQTGEATGTTLPASLAVGAWLLERASWAAAPIAGVAVAERLDPDACGALGADLGGSADRVAMLVLGDGSACRTLKAPGYLDDRAEAFDAAAARALGSADVPALAAIDPELALELKAAGRAPWQVLAGAARDAGLDGRLLYEDAPYGVGYFVAAWS